jgi:hypothetical protein
MSVNEYVFIFIYICRFVNILCHILHHWFCPIKRLWNIHNSNCNVTSIFQEGKNSCKYCWNRRQNTNSNQKRSYPQHLFWGEAWNFVRNPYLTNESIIRFHEPLLSTWRKISLVQYFSAGRILTRNSNRNYFPLLINWYNYSSTITD